MSPDEKAEKDEVTINIGMPRPLHRRLSITCAVLDVSLKAALMAGASMWIDENAHAVARALPQPPAEPRKSKGKGDKGGAAEGPKPGEGPADRESESDLGRA